MFRARVQLDYIPQYPNPLMVVAGETVRVGREDEEFPGCKWCRAADGREGWVRPVELLSIEAGDDVPVTQDYSSRELSVRLGQEVLVIEAGWVLVRDSDGDCGWLPESVVQRLNE